MQRLIDSTLPFVEKLLKKHGEFFPLAAAIKINNEIAQVGTYNGDDRPLSTNLIDDLKSAFRAKKSDYKIIAIFYDVKVVIPNTNIKTDAVAVFIESSAENLAYTFYFPYTLTPEKQLVYSDSWKEIADKEIFNV